MWPVSCSIRKRKQKNRRKHRSAERCFNFYTATQVCKPGSVLTAIYLALWLPIGSSRLPGTIGQIICPSTALLRDRVYSVKPMLPWAGWALTPPFHPCRRQFTHTIDHFTAGGKAHPVCGISSFLSNPLARGFDGSPVGPAEYLCCTCPEVTLGGRYPLSLALWSPDFPHPGPFGLRPRLSDLVAEILYPKEGQMSNVLANSFVTRYTVIENLLE